MREEIDKQYFSVSDHLHPIPLLDPLHPIPVLNPLHSIPVLFPLHPIPVLDPIPGLSCLNYIQFQLIILNPFWNFLHLHLTFSLKKQIYSKKLHFVET